MVNIYLLKCPITNNVRYIGKTIKSLNTRLANHISEKHKNYKNSWIKSLKAKGLKPIIELIEIVENEIWIEREIYWIKYYKDKGAKLCNLTIGGEGNNGGVHSKETKLKLSLANKGKNRYPKSLDTKRKLSNSIKNYRIDKGINNTMFGGNRDTKGSNNKFSKLNENLVLQIKQLLSNNVSVTTIANKFNVTKATISYIKNNKTWTHVKNNIK